MVVVDFFICFWFVCYLWDYYKLVLGSFFWGIIWCLNFCILIGFCGDLVFGVIEEEVGWWSYSLICLIWWKLGWFLILRVWSFLIVWKLIVLRVDLVNIKWRKCMCLCVVVVRVKCNYSISCCWIMWWDYVIIVMGEFCFGLLFIGMGVI